MRVGRVAAAGLVGGEEDLGTAQGGDSYIFTEVGVIYPNCYTAWRLTFRADGRCSPFTSGARRTQRYQDLIAELGPNPDVGASSDFLEQ